MNNRRKSLYILIMILSVALVFAGCKDKKTDSDTTTEASTEINITEEPVVDDNSSGENIPMPDNESKTDEDGFIVRDDYVKANSDNVNVRTAPSTDATIFKILNTGDVVKRTGDKADWTRIMIDNTEFYVYTEYVEVTDPTETADDQTEPETDEDTTPGNTQITTKKKIIVIDAGNQATDNFEVEPIGPGSEETKQCITSGSKGIALGAKEYELNFEYAELLKIELEQRGYKVIMTRDSITEEMTNKERAEFANAAGATAVIRIQTNYSSDVNMTGVMTVCMSEDSIYNSNLHNESYVLSTRILQGLTASTEATNRGIYTTDRLTFVNWSKIPVSVIKIGYLSNIGEEANLCDDTYKAKVVTGIADGLDYYFNN